MSQSVIEYLVGQDLYFIPLHSVHNGVCTCLSSECPSPGKHPLIKFNWKIVATNDLEKINRWMKNNKHLNFAVATGRKSKITDKYLVVVDVDKGASNIDVVSRLPTTFSYKTGSGGYHYWYWSKYPVKNSVSLVEHKVDIRGKNGYVVIPPSKNILGDYEFLSSETQEIAELPKFIYDHVFVQKTTDREKSPKSSKKTKELTALASKWSEYSIPEIRKLIQSGESIPCGVRNVTCFRVLASERAKGALELTTLLKVGKEIQAKMEESETFNDEEIENIARSVMRYPAYNNSHQKVNQCYIRWLEKNGTEVDDVYKDKLCNLDDKFFASCLCKTEGLKFGTCSLKQLMEAREKFFKSNDFPTFSSYKPQLMAKKLEELGFRKIRTASGNVWAISINV
jgi:hypothetical protein